MTFYCDMHAHSWKHNIFIYGCKNLKRQQDQQFLEQVFPLMLHKNASDKFSFEDCEFRVQKNKAGTGRIVMWVLGVTNSYTLEASFAGSNLNGQHFSTMVRLFQLPSEGFEILDPPGFRIMNSLARHFVQP